MLYTSTIVVFLHMQITVCMLARLCKLGVAFETLLVHWPLW
jgi:hypothetical protein